MDKVLIADLWVPLDYRLRHVYLTLVGVMLYNGIVDCVSGYIVVRPYLQKSRQCTRLLGRFSVRHCCFVNFETSDPWGRGTLQPSRIGRFAGKLVDHDSFYDYPEARMNIT
jgi:hypothetical protein